MMNPNVDLDSSQIQNSRDLEKSTPQYVTPVILGLNCGLRMANLFFFGDLYCSHNVVPKSKMTNNCRLHNKMFTGNDFCGQ